MTVRAHTPESVELLLGQQWVFEVSTTDVDGRVVDDVPTLVVTLPGDTTANPTFTRVRTGCFRAAYTVLATGRYVALATATGAGTAGFVAWVDGTTAGTAMPTVDDAKEYIGETSWSDEEIAKALDAEASNQRKACDIGATYPADLREALLRRVHRNLIQRNLLGGQSGDGSEGAASIAGRDPEVRRLEGPYRKRVAL